MNFTLEQIAKAVSGKIIQGSPATKIRGVSTNSRTITRGELFIAIRGERFDAHSFLPEVVKRSAGAVVISHIPPQLPAGMPAVLVKDTVKALGRIARAHRDQFSIPVIGITGSAGKTTTKEMLSQVLKAKFRVLKNSGTENNHIGVPLTLLKIKPSHEVVIVEMGTNRFGDIPWLVEVARPTIAIVTNIGASHLAQLKSPADVFKEKSALITAIAPGGKIIVNQDDRFLKTVRQHTRHRRVLTFGQGRGADYRATDIHFDHRQRLSFRVNQRQTFVLSTFAPAFVANALVAITCGRALGINYNRIQRQLKEFRSPAGRQGLLSVGKFWILDDSYNANPVSFRCALEALAGLKPGHRKILVCGDMLELGKASLGLHRNVGVLAADGGVDAVFSFGSHAPLIGQAAKRKRPGTVLFSSSDIEALQKKLIDFCLPGDVILVKGSRGMHLERVVEFLKTNLKEKRP